MTATGGGPHTPGCLVNGLPSAGVSLTAGGTDRVYRASCPHGSWWIVVAADAPQPEHLPVTCHAGCPTLQAVSIEPR